MITDTVSLDKLAEFFVLSPRRIRQLLDDGHVVRAADGKNFEFLPSVKAYIAYLQQASVGKTASKEGQDHQAAKITLLNSQNEQLQLKLSEAKGSLVPLEHVTTNTVRIVKTISEGCNNLVDFCEKRGITGDALDAIDAAQMQWRNALHNELYSVLGGEAITDESQTMLSDLSITTGSLEPVAAEPELPKKNPRGRPRKVAGDKFTGDLIG
jgi:phage terminase Nu1 subunit (DNA packaging protein)